MQAYIAVFFLIFLTSCTREDQSDQSRNTFGQFKFGQTVAILEMDTIAIDRAPSRITRKIRKDKKGNLLLASFDRVIRYDGVSFLDVPKLESFESPDAFDALEDSKGNIWIASTHHGIFCYDGKDYKHFTKDQGLASNRTIDLMEDSKGNIWIATIEGLSCFDGQSFHNYTTKDGLSHNDVFSMLEDQTGIMWFGTRGTVCVFDPASSSFSEITDPDGVTFNGVWSIIEDRAGNIWMACENGLWRYDGVSYKRFSTDVANCVYEDGKGNIWTTSPSGVLSRYDYNLVKEGKSFPMEIFKSDNMLFRVIEDYENNIWIGAINGVMKYDGKIMHYLIPRN